MISFFDPKWSTVLTVDAGPDGLGAVLTQINPENLEDKKIIMFISRSLNETEKSILK